jgi:hypothetical protein
MIATGLLELEDMGEIVFERNSNRGCRPKGK